MVNFIQGESPSMLTPFFFNNVVPTFTVVQNLIFGISKYTRRPYFQVVEIFVLFKECPVAI